MRSASTPIARCLATAIAVALAATLALLCLPGSVMAATVTIGPPLPGANYNYGTCGGCSVVDTGLTGPEGIVSSPVDGVIVAWRLNQTSPGLEFRLRVVTPDPGGSFTATATSAPEKPLAEGLETFPTDLPIEAGQMVGIDAPLGGEVGDADSPEGGLAAFSPPLAEGVPSPITEDEREVVWEFDAEVLPRPTLGGIGPAMGPPAGGTSVVLEGSNLEYVESVDFGSQPAASYAVESESRITAVAPPGTGGEVPVTVTTEAGTATAPDPFVYEAPPSTPSPPTPPSSSASKQPAPAPFSVGAPTIDRSKGTATLAVTVPGPGTLSVRATGTKTPTHLEAATVNVAGPGTVAVPLAVTAAGRLPLRRVGAIKLVPLVTFTPSAGAPEALYRRVTLKLR